MPELRKDPIVGRWVIIATERSNRPVDWSTDEPVQENGTCPFCPGNEALTPPAITTVGPEDDWQVRVVPNRYPALQIEGELARRGEGMFDLMNGIGAHEVIIESADHQSAFSRFSTEKIATILSVYRSRILDLKHDRRFKYILVFRNSGREAGASLRHPHSQLIATPIVPKSVIEELEGARKHWELKERCIFCDIIRQEITAGTRVIAENQGFVALAAFAARFPYEAWILPKTHASHYESMQGSLDASLAALLKDVLSRLDSALGSPPYNFVLHSMPLQMAPAPDYHWHIEIIPKLSSIAGFEWGSGFYINPTPPEMACRHLKEIMPSAVPAEKKTKA